PRERRDHERAAQARPPGRRLRHRRVPARADRRAGRARRDVDELLHLPPPRLMHVEPGTELPPLRIESVPAEAMKTVAALLHDPTPIHWDVESVRALGMGDRPVNQGPNNMAYVVNMLTTWAGSPGRIRRLRVRFLGNVFAGDSVTARGVVTGVR